MERSVTDRKRAFRNLVRVFEKYPFGLTDGLTHFKGFIRGVVIPVSIDRDIGEARELLEAATTLTSTKLGHKVLSIAKKIIDNKRIGNQFIDAEIISNDIILHFDRKNAPGVFMEKVDEVVSAYGALQIFSLPGDELFEGVYAQGYIMSLTPRKAKVAEACRTSKKRKKQREETKKAVREALLNGKRGFRVTRVTLADQHCAQCQLTNDQLDVVFEIAYGLTELSEVEREEVRRNISEAVVSAGIPVRSMRKRMIMAVAGKGLRTKVYNEKHLRTLYAWEDFIEEVLSSTEDFKNFLK